MAIERDYMVTRCLKILFSDFGQRKGTPEEISYTINNEEFDSINYDEKINFLIEILFLRKYLPFAITFLTQIMPYITNRLNFSTKKDFRKTNDEYIRGKINWTRTLMCEYQGSEYVIIENIRRQYTSPENLITVLTLLEIHFFALVLYNDLKVYLNRNSIEYRQLVGILRRCSKFLRMNTFQECQIMLKPLFSNEKKYLRNYLLMDGHRNSALEKSKLYNYFVYKIIQKIIGKKIHNPYYLKLLNWRKNFFSNAFVQFSSDPNNDFIDISGEVDGNWTDSTLYELWILFEVLNSLARRKNFLIKQNPTIPGAFFGISKEPLFYIYYKNENIFNTLNQPKIYGVHYNKTIGRSNNMIRTELRGWALRNRPDIVIFDLLKGNIIVTIDTKEYTNTGFKVTPIKEMLGYMNNFKTDLGVVIFSCLQKKINANNLIFNSDNFTHIQDYDRLEELLIISLKPNKSLEKINTFLLIYRFGPIFEDHLLSKILPLNTIVS